jgi:hypothetical protein
LRGESPRYAALRDLGVGFIMGRAWAVWARTLGRLYTLILPSAFPSRISVVSDVAWCSEGWEVWGGLQVLCERLGGREWLQSYLSRYWWRGGGVLPVVYGLCRFVRLRRSC